MAFEGFKPTIWSDRVIVNTDRKFVYGNVARTDFEGEVANYGNIIKINEIGDISVSDYTSTGINWEGLTEAQKELVIDQRKYFAFGIEDVDSAQMKPKMMDNAMSKASHAIKNTVDTFLAGKYTEAGVLNTSNLGSSGSRLTVNANDMLELLTYMDLYMNQNDAPDDRWVIWPPVFIQYLKYAEIVQNAAGTPDAPNSPALRNGWIDATLGWDHYMSNNVNSSGSNYNIMFGTYDALAFVGQVETIEAVRREDYFQDGVKGLYVYGAKTIRPDHLGCAYLTAGGVTS